MWIFTFICLSKKLYFVLFCPCEGSKGVVESATVLSRIKLENPVLGENPNILSSYFFRFFFFRFFFPLFSIFSRKSLLSSHCAYAAQNASKPNHEFRLSPSLSMIFLAIFFSMHFFLNIIAYLGRIIAWLLFKSE